MQFVSYEAKFLLLLQVTFRIGKFAHIHALKACKWSTRMEPAILIQGDKTQSVSGLFTRAEESHLLLTQITKFSLKFM